jgi:hypothetical protein
VGLTRVLLDFLDEFRFRTARRPAAVAGRLKLLGHRLTLPLVPARRNPDRDVGLPIEEITEKLDDSRVAGERLDGFRRLPFVDTEKLIRIGWVPAEAGHTTVSIQGNASQVVLRVPGDVAAAITVEDTGASIEVELASFPYAGERTFRSLNYDAAANRVDVYAELAFGSLRSSKARAHEALRPGIGDRP